MTEHRTIEQPLSELCPNCRHRMFNWPGETIECAKCGYQWYMEQPKEPLTSNPQCAYCAQHLLIERLTAERDEATEKLDRWYEAEARIRGALEALGGNDLFRRAIERAGRDTGNPIVAERDRLTAKVTEQEQELINSTTWIEQLRDTEARLRAALEWYSSATQHERSKDNGARAREAFAGAADSASDQ